MLEQEELLAGAEELGDRLDEVAAGERGLDAAAEDGLEGNVFAVVGAGIVLVLIDNVAGEVDASEEALAARVGEKLRVGEDGGGGLRVAADRACGCRDVSAEFDLILQKALEALVVGGDEDEIRGLTAGLEAEACAGHLDEDGGAPAMAGAAGQQTLTVLRSDEEGSLFEAGNDRYAGRLGGDLDGNALIRCGHQFVQDGVGSRDALTDFGGVGSGG